MLRVVVVVEMEVFAVRVEASELAGEDEPAIALASLPTLENPLSVKLAGS
jgi:hypothetical protein